MSQSRDDLFEKRRALMHAWAGFLGSAEHGTKVVALSMRQPVTA